MAVSLAGRTKAFIAFHASPAVAERMYELIDLERAEQINE
jgi:hypothetical protein